MTSNDFDLPLYSQRLTSETYTWSNLQDCLDEHRRRLEEICAEQGPQAASIAQEELMSGMNDRALMERMFLEANWRSPSDKKLINGARSNYFALMLTLSSSEERHYLEMLRDISESLQDILKKLHNGEKVDYSFDQEKMYETVGQFNEFAEQSEEAQNLINNIISYINELARLQEK